MDEFNNKNKINRVVVPTNVNEKVVKVIKTDDSKNKKTILPILLIIIVILIIVFLLLVVLPNKKNKDKNQNTTVNIENDIYLDYYFEEKEVDEIKESGFNLNSININDIKKIALVGNVVLIQDSNKIVSIDKSGNTILTIEKFDELYMIEEVIINSSGVVVTTKINENDICSLDNNVDITRNYLITYNVSGFKQEIIGSKTKDIYTQINNLCN